MTAGDAEAVLAFAAALPPHDLIFLQRMIRNSKVVAAWIEQSARGAITSLLALADGTVRGCAAIVQDEFSWSPHVGELRVVVSEDIMRGSGLGRVLVQDAFALAIARPRKTGGSNDPGSARSDRGFPGTRIHAVKRCCATTFAISRAPRMTLSSSALTSRATTRSSRPTATAKFSDRGRMAPRRAPAAPDDPRRCGRRRGSRPCRGGWNVPRYFRSDGP